MIVAWGRVAKSATFGVKWASDESFCPSTVRYPFILIGRKGLSFGGEEKCHL